MAAIAIPESIQVHFPHSIEPAQLWVNYNPQADSLTVYFTGQPVPSVWNDLDEFVYLGFALDNEAAVTGMMIEHFSKWLLVSGRHQERLAQPA